MAVAYVSATRSPGSVHHSAGLNCRYRGESSRETLPPVTSLVVPGWGLLAARSGMTYCPCR
jgi:hypothetical protein